MHEVMKRAWELVKEGVTKFGGKVREYFAAALTIAWKEFKTMTEIKLVGTEKQIKWAMDIRAKLAETIDRAEAYGREYIEKMVEMGNFDDEDFAEETEELDEKVAEAKAYYLERTLAKDYIEKFNNTTPEIMIGDFFKNRYIEKCFLEESLGDR